MNARLIPDRSPRFTRRDLPCIPSPNTRRALPSLLRCSTSVTGSPVASAFRVWTSPCIRRLVATYGRIEFVILRTACSPPVALHPASLRRSYLQLSGMSIPRERTFTSLIAPAPGRTDTGLHRHDDTVPRGRLCRNYFFVIPCKRSATRNPVFSACSIGVGTTH